ncbi:MAG: hypothetical protein ABSD96_18505 [Candidatus Korobacteraceae bacterium]|jgi:hypothetical protein
MSNTKAITDLAEMELLTEAPAVQRDPASAGPNPGIAALLGKWLGYTVQLQAEPKTAQANDDVDDDWEKWLHECGRAVR